MTYRAAPVTQRDSSPLASSNCRMASIATGLDFETLGADKSTGAKMRSYQDDQSGGTDSGDARQAWDRGYGETLRVMDGHTFDDALADLRAGRLVHLDVWHAAVGGPCLSGSGAYGHTMAVAPEQDGDKWLVADPWCSPPKWSWVAESKLRAGAESWGGQVFTATAGDPDYPIGGGYRDPRVLAIASRIAKRWMSQHDPSRPATSPHADTGGGKAILYTTTKAQGGGHDMAITTRGLTLSSQHAVTLPEGTSVREYPDGSAPEVGKFGGAHDYFGGTNGWKAIRVSGPDGSVIAYTSTAATVWDKSPEPGGDTAGRQAQWDADAASLLGPRP